MVAMQIDRGGDLTRRSGLGRHDGDGLVLDEDEGGDGWRCLGERAVAVPKKRGDRGRMVATAAALECGSDTHSTGGRTRQRVKDQHGRWCSRAEGGGAALSAF